MWAGAVSTAKLSAGQRVSPDEEAFPFLGDHDEGEVDATDWWIAQMEAAAAAAEKKRKQAGRDEEAEGSDHVTLDREHDGTADGT